MTASLKLYKYGELRTKAAKDKARQWWIDGENNHFDSDRLTEFMKYEAEFLYGLTDLNIYWSLNNCQGDGVAFDGVVDMESICKLPTPADGDMQQFEPTLDERMQVAKLWMQLQDMGYSLCVHVKQQGHYAHWNSMTVTVDVDHEPEFGNLEAVNMWLRQQNLGHDPMVKAALEASEELEECGCCGCYHRRDYAGDCRNDAERFNDPFLPIDNADVGIILICCDYLEERGIDCGQVRAILQVEEDEANALVNDLENALDDYFKECSRDLEERGYVELEDRESEEYVADMLIANDYTFNYKGERCD